MAELTPKDVLEIAVKLYQAEPPKLTARQFDCWYYARYLGQGFREAAKTLWYDYEISYQTVMMDSRYAHEIIVQACYKAMGDEARLGVTVKQGHEAWWEDDETLIQSAWKVRNLKRGSKKKVQTGRNSAIFRGNVAQI